MPKNKNKWRAISGTFNLGLFGLLVVSFTVLLWQLPDRASSAVQTLAGRETPSVPTEDAILFTSSVTATVVFTLPVPARLGVVIDEKRAVVLIEPDSPAEKAGLQLGDILERMEGTPLLHSEDRMKARFLMNDIHKEKGYRLRLTVIRNGVTIELPFMPEPPFNPVVLPDPPPPTITPVWPPYDFL